MLSSLSFSRCFAAALVLGLAGLSAPPARAQIAKYHTKDEALQLAFPDGEAIAPVPLHFDDAKIGTIESHARIKKFNPDWIECYQGSEGETVTAYACIDNVIGKSKPITYVIRIDHPAGTIALIEVMQYREQAGGMVRYPHFKAQFLGKTAADPMELKKTIRNISGATMSSRGLTEGFRKVLAIYDLMLRGLPRLHA